MSVTLHDFSTEKEAPKIRCDYWIPHPVHSGEMVGTIGIEKNRNNICGLFLHRRHDKPEANKTYNTEFGGYAISDWILKVLDHAEAYKVYIAVTDENEMYEFDLKQYLDGIGFEWREDDPQHCVPLSQSVGEWAGSDCLLTDPNDTKRLDVNHARL